MSIYKGNNLVAGSGLSVNFTPDAVPTEGSQHVIMSGGMYDALLTKETTTNKTTTINASSTDGQYPSAKAVYDALGNHVTINIDYARDLYAPDWSQAVTISQDALLSGYTVPKRGIFVGSTIPFAERGAGHITLNGVVIGYGFISGPDFVTGGGGVSGPGPGGGIPYPGADIRVAYVNTPASPGDVLKSDFPMLQDGHYTIYFIPYKRQ